MTSMLALFLTTLLVSHVGSLDNHLALTPPMGWLSWERFLCNTDCETDPSNCINERLYMQMADRLACDGYKDVGYEYINIDDCWMSTERDPISGRLCADPKRFPSGIRALAEFVHSRGLKLGIYQDCGTKTCAGFPGSLGYYDVDAITFAEWGVDMVKFDGCYADPAAMDQLYPQMGCALNHSGRAMVYSCSWPDYQRAEGMVPDYTTISQVCNLWRNFDDITDSWSSILSVVKFYGDSQQSLVPVTGPGHWNDPDMIMVGNYGLSYEESKAQLALWAVFAAPLMLAADLRIITPEMKNLLQNKLVIGVDQDPLGKMGEKIYNRSNIEIWRRPISPVSGCYYSYALVFFNRRNIGGPVTLTFCLQDLGLCNPSGYNLRDLFSDSCTPPQVCHHFHIPTDSMSITVNPSGVTMITACVHS